MVEGAQASGSRRLYYCGRSVRAVSGWALIFEAGEDRQQDPKEETNVGKYVASCRWQPLDRIGTIWRDVWSYLFDLLRIFWSCQGRGREFESRFPLHNFFPCVRASVRPIREPLLGANFVCPLCAQVQTGAAAVLLMSPQLNGALDAALRERRSKSVTNSACA